MWGNMEENTKIYIFLDIVLFFGEQGYFSLAEVSFFFDKSSGNII